jgi:hypothetical protein
MFEKAPPQKAPLYLNTPNQKIPKPTTFMPTMPTQHPHNVSVLAAAMTSATARTPTPTAYTP